MTETTTRLSDLPVGALFRLGTREHRVVWHWSTGVEIAQLASWGLAEKRVVAAATVVTAL